MIINNSNEADEKRLLDLGLLPRNKEIAKDIDLLITPKVITASALFTTRNQKQPREYARRKEIVVAPGIGSLKYTGEELRYPDLEVWQMLIELARSNEIHKNSYILMTNLRQILKSLGRDTGGKAYETFRDCLERLKATSLSFESISGMNIKSFSLLQKYEIKEKNSLTISLDPEIYKLFQSSDLVLLSANDLRSMPDLTKKIYGIIKSDLKSYLTVEQYMDLTGNDYKRVTQFKVKLISALKQLLVGGHISNWRIEKIDKEYIVFVNELGTIPNPK